MLVLVALVAGLMAASLWLARYRIFQVDECQNMFVARILATGTADRAFTGVTLYLAPLTALSNVSDRAFDLFSIARLFGWCLFWVNIWLLVRACGRRVNDVPGALTFLGAATLAPVWDYGFEIRHDNLLLAGLLTMWWTLRTAPRGRPSFVIAGALVVMLEFIAFKAFLYTVPISLAALVMPDVRHGSRRLRLVVAWLAGCVGSLIALRLTYEVAGWWDIYIRDFRGISGVAVGAERFGAGVSLQRMAIESPLVTALACIGVVSAMVQTMRVRDRSAWYQTSGPEAGVLLVAVSALLINPTPYPYNLVNLVPFCFLLAHREVTARLETRNLSGITALAAVAAVATCHLLPFVGATVRHFRMTNARQVTVMRLAEDLTDAKRDRVYDGIGMVLTRSSVGYDWFLHSLNIRRFTGRNARGVRAMLEANPAAVFIPNYRTDWLSDEDHRFIRERYVPLADDLWVLGSVGPPGGGDFDVVHQGRYIVVHASALQGLPDSETHRETLAVRLNSVAVVDGVVDLTVGRHRIECDLPCRPALVWLGPRLDQLPRLAPGDHRALFVNWY